MGNRWSEDDLELKGDTDGNIQVVGAAVANGGVDSRVKMWALVAGSPLLFCERANLHMYETALMHKQF